MSSPVWLYSSRPLSLARCVVSADLREQLERLTPLLSALLDESRLLQTDVGVDDLMQAVVINANMTAIKMHGSARTVYVVPDPETKSVTALALVNALVNAVTSDEVECVRYGDAIVRARPVGNDPDEFHIVIE